MAKIEQCSLCQTQCTVAPQPDSTGHPVYLFNCPVCGDYITTHSVALSFLQTRKESLYIISGITRNYFELNRLPFTITEKMICDDLEFQAEFLSKAPKSVLDKASLLSQHIARKSHYPGDQVRFDLSRDYPICFCKNSRELYFYIKCLKETGDIEYLGDSGGYDLFLTSKGWQKNESMAKPNLGSKRAFVAMWFDENLKEIFTNGINPLEEDTGFEMYRVDQEPFNEKICDRIIAEIKKSRFLIADVTGLRHAVFFEAGYAMGLGLPVIFTCKEGTEMEGCFDTRQYNHIVWENAEDLKSKLKDRILATIGKSTS
jgi:hypothetical protein